MQKGKMGGWVAAAVALILAGGFIACVFGVTAVFSVFRTTGSALLLFCAGGAWSSLCVARGIHMLMVADRSRKAVRLTEKNGGRMNVSQLADALGRPEDKLLEDLGQMMARRFYPKAKIDLTRKELVINDTPPPDKLLQETIYREKSLRSPLWAFWAAASALVTVLGFASATLPNLLIGLAGAAVAFVLVFVLSPNALRYTEIPYPAPQAKSAETGDADLDAMLNTAIGHMNELADLDRKITDPKIDGKVELLTKTAWEIIDHVRRRPDKLRQIRQFLSYYLPTTVKLLTEYVSFSRQEVQTGSVKRSMEKIEGMLDLIAGAFRRELDNFYLDKEVDIAAEIDVMKGMFQREGLDAMDITKNTTREE